MHLPITTLYVYAAMPLIVGAIACFILARSLKTVAG